jgi:aminoglycoside phosphotransferase (APT) family kinase protein
MTDLSDADLAAVSDQLSAAGVSHTRLTATLIAGGRSNLTYVLSDGGSRWVLRTPPRWGRTPSAHDVGREYRVTSALAAHSAVPVARPVLICEDEVALGVPFTVVEFVHGAAVRTRSDLDRLDDGTVALIARSLVETLAELHRVDHVAAGLAGFGRPDGYAARQLRRWAGQWELVGSEQPGAAELVARLTADVPEQLRAAVVHGDYRIDNTLLRLDGGASSEPRVAAVVDWELSTVGDPVADLAMMVAYRDSAFDLVLGEPSAWTSPRLPPEETLLELYESSGGADLAGWRFHLALAFFKVAVIAAGIDHRGRAAGQRESSAVSTAGQAVPRFLERGLDTIRGRD